MSQIPKGLIETHEKLKNDFRFYARHALKIKTKEGDILPFIFNDAQNYLHDKLEEQKKSTGKVRALILKGRQQGCSTYTEGRGYHRSTSNKGVSVFILSHEAETTKKLFRMVERFHENCPEPLTPVTTIANRRELQFAELASDYAVGTAGNENVGRGGTIQFFHGSEVAFWLKTQEIKTGILQSIPDAPNTEIILESTANGLGNMFYDMCMQALEGIGEYILVFIPWFWQSEYQRDVPENLKLSADDVKYMETYKLSMRQMAWRAQKIIDLGPQMFKQEYPANVMEAFQTSGECLIDNEDIMRARKAEIKDPYAPFILGVDPARSGDRTVFAERRGREMVSLDSFKLEKTKDPTNPTPWQMLIAGRIANRINSRKYDKVFVDVGEGWGVVDRLVEMGYGKVVQGVAFGSESIEKDMYLNKRAEMWCLMRDWIEGDTGGVSLIDDDKLHKDFMVMPKETHTSRGLKKLLSKKEIRKLHGFSPDCGDALALTFAFPVKRRYPTGQHQSFKKKKGTSSPLLTTRNRFSKQRTVTNRRA